MFKKTILSLALLTPVLGMSKGFEFEQVWAIRLAGSMASKPPIKTRENDIMQALGLVGYQSAINSSLPIINTIMGSNSRSF